MTSHPVSHTVRTFAHTHVLSHLFNGITHSVDQEKPQAHLAHTQTTSLSVLTHTHTYIHLMQRNLRFTLHIHAGSVSLPPLSSVQMSHTSMFSSCTYICAHTSRATLAFDVTQMRLWLLPQGPYFVFYTSVLLL